MTFFYNNAINIYTDASITNKNSENIGAPGFLLYKGNDLCEVKKLVIHNCNNNFGELYAIKLALEYGISYCYNGNPNEKPLPINIFSDSLISVNSIRKWLVVWTNNSRERSERTLINNQNLQVKNQNILLDIMNIILFFNTNINIYHVTSHLKPNKIDDINLFRNKFYDTNNIYIKDINLIRHMICCNNHIDEVTRLHLKRVTNDENYDPEKHKIVYPISWFPTEEEIKNYSNLVNS